MKPSKCSLYKEKINYLPHQVSKEGVQPSDTNLKAIAECAPPRTYTEIRAFLSLIGHYRQFIRGFVRIAQPLNKHLVGEGASRKSEQVSLSKEALEAFQALKQACMNSPVLAFTDYTKDFLLETDASKEELGAVLSQKQEDGWFHLVVYGSQALTMHEKNYHSPNLVLYNSKVVQKNNRYFDLSSRYFLYPLTSLPYMVMRKRLLPPSSTNSLFW